MCINAHTDTHVHFKGFFANSISGCVGEKQVEVTLYGYKSKGTVPL